MRLAVSRFTGRRDADRLTCESHAAFGLALPSLLSRRLVDVYQADPIDLVELQRAVDVAVRKRNLQIKHASFAVERSDLLSRSSVAETVC